MIARRHTDGTGGTNSACMEIAVFITMGFLVSSFALPIVLARSLVVCINNIALVFILSKKKYAIVDLGPICSIRNTVHYGIKPKA